MKNLTLKILTAGLTAALLTGCLTACNASAKGAAAVNNTTAAVVQNETKAAEENKELTGPQVTVGGWTVPESHEVTAEHKKIFKEAISKIDGYSHEPVALLATQLVAGTNYCFYCKSTATASSGPLSSVITYINVKPDGTAEYICDSRDFFYTSENVPGGWENAADPSITEDIKKIMAKATETITGEDFEPVAYIASQVVAGKNHAILCKATPSTKGLSNEAKYVIVTIYENLEGKCEISKITDVSLGIK